MQRRPMWSFVVDEVGEAAFPPSTRVLQSQSSFYNYPIPICHRPYHQMPLAGDVSSRNIKGLSSTPPQV